MGIGTPFTVVSTATRHMLDADVTFGMSSSRYNARDKYRNSYTDAQRTAAGIGTVLGVAIPVTAGAAWIQKSLAVPGITGAEGAAVTGLEKAKVLGMSPGVVKWAGRAAGAAALTAAIGVGAKKSWEISQDDGNLGAFGGATGVLAGAAAGVVAGRFLKGRSAAVAAGVGAAVGGVAGHFAGKAIDGDSSIGKKLGLGASQVGVPFEQAAQVDANAADRVKSFGRGAFNHFNEVGPATQGISFGYSWGMRDTVQTKYSNSERAGAMHGDLLAAGIMGGGAMAVVASMARAGATPGASALAAGASTAGAVLERGPLMNMASKLGTTGSAAAAGAAAAGIIGLAGYKGYQSDSETFGKPAAAAIAAGTGALALGTGIAATRVAMSQGLSKTAAGASGALVGAALIGVLSSARLPLQQFMNDAKDSVAADGGVKWSKAGPAAGIGAAAAGFGAFKGLSKLVPADGVHLGKFTLSKGLVVGAGAAISAAAGGGMGLGLSSTRPDDYKPIGRSVAGGALAGAAAGGFARGIGVVPGVIGGAALGLTASSLLRKDAAPAAPAPTTPQEAAGTAAG
jgi:hypothetical protein